MIGLTLLISIVWAANVLVGLIDPTRHDPTVNAVFAIVVGAVFALGRKDDPHIKDARRRLARMIAGEPDEPKGEGHDPDDQSGEQP